MRGRASQNDPSPWIVWGLLGVAASVALSFAILFEAQVEGSNGPAYWRWPFLAREPVRFALAVVPALLIAALAWREHHRSRKHARALACISAAFLWLELGLVGLEGGRYDLRRVGWIVVHPNATSYWNAALDLLARNPSQWLARWHEHMAAWPLHARNKPLLPVLYYAAMHRLADRDGAMLGGLLILVTTALVIPGTYRVSLALGAPPRAALRAAGLAALCPALSLIAPEFDQIYVLVTLAASGGWMLAIRRGGVLPALFTGLSMFVATSFAFHLAVLGLPLAVFAVLEARADRALIGRAVRAGVLALVAFGVAHLALHFITGYDPIAVFAQALADRRTMSAYDERVGPESRFFDLADFALGLGWPTALAGVASVAWPGGVVPAARHLAIAGWVTALLLAMLRLLPTETARTWMFLGPLLLPAIGCWLDRCSPAQRVFFTASALIFLLATARNLIFVAV